MNPVIPAIERQSCEVSEVRVRAHEELAIAEP
jgi:hypothetical protein